VSEEQYWNRKVADQLAQINSLLRALVTIGLAGMKIPMAEKVRILADGGFTPSEIAGMIGTTSNTVSVTLYQQRKRKKHAKTPQSETQG
jgi:hypothetical protein